MKTALDHAALDQLFRKARSYNRWTRGEVSDEQLEALYELFKFGPTSANCCPARFVFVKSPEARARLVRCVNPGNVTKVEQAPVTVIVGMDLEFYERVPELFPHNPGAREWFVEPESARVNALRNGSLQGAYLILAARALGLDCGPMSGFDNARVDAEFFAGTTVRSNFLCALGHGTTEKLHPRGPRLPFGEACRIE